MGSTPSSPLDRDQNLVGNGDNSGSTSNGSFDSISSQQELQTPKPYTSPSDSNPSPPPSPNSNSSNINIKESTNRIINTPTLIEGDQNEQPAQDIITIANYDTTIPFLGVRLPNYPTNEKFEQTHFPDNSIVSTTSELGEEIEGNNEVVSHLDTDQAPHGDIESNNEKSNDDEESNNDEDSEETNPLEESVEDYPSGMFIPLEQRTLSELQNLDLDELDWQQPPSKVDTMLWRMGVICVCLITIWVTSFPVLTAFVSSAIPSPSLSQVVDRWDATVQATWSQIENTQSCFNTAYNDCDGSLDQGILNFRESMAATFAELDSALIESNNLYTPCGSQHTDIVRAFNIHRELGYPIAFDTNVCTPTEIQQTRDLIGYDDDSFANRIIAHLNAVQEEWAYRFSNVTESVDNRLEYDRIYFGNKFDQLKVTFLQLQAITLNIDAEFQTLSLNLLDLNPLNFIPSFQPYPMSLEIEAYRQRFLSLWTNAQDIWIDARDKAKGMGYPNLFPDFSVAFPSSSLDFDSIFSALNVGRDYLVNMAINKVKQFQNLGTNLRNTMDAKLAELEARVSDKLNRIETSFNPPSVNVDMPTFKSDISLALDLQFQTISATIDKIADQVGVYKSQGKELAEEVIDAMNPLPYITQHLSLINLDRLEWPLLFQYGDYMFIFDTLAQINMVIFAFDIIYRITSTIQIVFNYGKLTQSSLGRQDLRRNGSDHNRLVDFISKLPYGFMGPALTVLTTLIFIVIMLMYIVFSYIQMYEGYVAGCVESRDSTFVGETAYTIAYNFANDTTRASGNVRQQAYVAKSWGMCKNETYAIEQAFQQKTFQLNLDSSSYTSNRVDISLLDRCINKPLTYTNINPVDSKGTLHTGQYLWTSSQTLVNTDKAHEILNNGAFQIQDLQLALQQREYEVNSAIQLEASEYLGAQSLSATEQEPPRERDHFDLLNERFPDPKHSFFRGKSSPFYKPSKTSVQNTDEDSQPEIYVSPDRVSGSLSTECTPFATGRYPWNGFEQNLSSPSECSKYVPLCTVTSCSPSIEVITIATHYSSCDSEWLLHSSIMRTIAVLIMLISLNISRVFLVKFMVQYLFNRLGNVDIEIVEFYRYHNFTTTITSAERREAIQKAVRSTQCKSTIWLALSLVIHIPWVVMLFSLMQSMTPMR